jgi:glutaredoxin 3
MKIKVYSTQSCPYCHMAKDFLTANKAEFEDIDISNDSQAAMEMVQKSGQMGVPVIEIDGKIIVGFDKEKIAKMIKK